MSDDDDDTHVPSILCIRYICHPHLLLLLPGDQATDLLIPVTSSDLFLKSKRSSSPPAVRTQVHESQDNPTDDNS